MEGGRALGQLELVELTELECRETTTAMKSELSVYLLYLR